MPSTRLKRPLVAELIGTVVGCLLVCGALAIIWVARGTLARDVYVSELGAQGMPTARWFELALLLIVVGGSLVAYAARGIRSSAPVLRAWAPAVSIWVACGFFLVASQVRCTAGCPVPVGDTFTWQTFVHTVAAVIAFAFACWAMLQMSLARDSRLLARLSLACGLGVAVIAGVGGIFSLASFEADFGSRLEFAATTIAIGWLVALGTVLIARLAVRLRPSVPREAEQFGPADADPA